MTDRALQFIPRFEFGDSSLQLTYPITRWDPGARTEGRMLTAAGGALGPALRLRKYLLAFSLRFTEDEWPDVIRFIEFAQTGASFTWFPNAQDLLAAPASVTVFLEEPRLATVVRPQRDPTLLYLFTLPIVLSRGEPWAVEYFRAPPDEEPVEPPPPPPGGDWSHNESLLLAGAQASGETEVRDDQPWGGTDPWANTDYVYYGPHPLKANCGAQQLVEGDPFTPNVWAGTDSGSGVSVAPVDCEAHAEAQLTRFLTITPNSGHTLAEIDHVRMQVDVIGNGHLNVVNVGTGTYALEAELSGGPVSAGRTLDSLNFEEPRSSTPTAFDSTAYPAFADLEIVIPNANWETSAVLYFTQLVRASVAYEAGQGGTFSSPAISQFPPVVTLFDSGDVDITADFTIEFDPPTPP